MQKERDDDKENPEKPPLVCLELPEQRPQTLNDDGDNASTNFSVCQYVGMVINMCLQHFNHEPASRRTLTIKPETVPSHLKWLEMFVMANYFKFRNSGVSRDLARQSFSQSVAVKESSMKASLTSIVFLAWMWLRRYKASLDGIQQQSQKKRKTSQEWATKWQLLCLAALEDEQKQSLVDLFMDWDACLEDVAFEFTMQPDTACQRRPALLEQTCATFAYISLQMHYWLAYGDKPTATVTLEERQVFNQHLQAMERIKTKFLSKAPGIEFCTRFNKMLSEHWLNCSRFEVYQRVNATGSDRLALNDIINQVLPREELDTLIAIQQNFGRHSKISLAVPLTGGTGGEQKMDTKSDSSSSAPMQDKEDVPAVPQVPVTQTDQQKRALRAAQDILDILIFVYMFEQEQGMKNWLDRYYIPAYQFAAKHAQLKEPKRHFDHRRPYITALLGRWQICTHEPSVLIVNTGIEAMAMFKTLVQTRYHGVYEGALL